MKPVSPTCSTRGSGAAASRSSGGGRFEHAAINEKYRKNATARRTLRIISTVLWDGLRLTGRLQHFVEIEEHGFRRTRAGTHGDDLVQPEVTFVARFELGTAAKI